VIDAKDADEAEAIARTSPHLRGRNRIEIRAVDNDSCDAVIDDARQQRQSVPA
jgi:hypothetical protein